MKYTDIEYYLDCGYFGNYSVKHPNDYREGIRYFNSVILNEVNIKYGMTDERYLYLLKRIVENIAIIASKPIEFWCCEYMFEIKSFIKLLKVFISNPKFKEYYSRYKLFIKPFIELDCNKTFNDINDLMEEYKYLGIAIDLFIAVKLKLYYYMPFVVPYISNDAYCLAIKRLNRNNCSSKIINEFEDSYIEYKLWLKENRFNLYNEYIKHLCLIISRGGKL